ncbi:MAG TPA: TPM domain-containing protein [Pyrinomonadaceae bacterium]|nr:TPM domain-containing protein [Pyrinomonadaceae bacterium]
MNQTVQVYKNLPLSNPGLFKAAFPHSTILLLFLLLIASITNSKAQSPTPWDPNTSPLGPPTGFVNDYVGVFDSQKKQELEKRLRDFRDKTGVELAVAIVRTTGERDIFDYSLAVARGWGIGSKDDDNPAALLFIAIDDRKFFTQVSRDLEDELPDGLVGQIQRQYLIPEFKKGNYSKGISDTLDIYMSVILSRTSGIKPKETPDDYINQIEPLPFGKACCIFIAFMVIFIFLARRKSSYSRSSFDSVAPFVAGSIVNSILSSSSHSGGSSWDSSSGGWGSSDFGGGFGGGGDFGGGGAGGDW